MRGTYLLAKASRSWMRTAPALSSTFGRPLRATNTAGPRLLRIQVFYDGAEMPSVDCPIGDFFAVGHGQEKDVNSSMVANVSEGRARNCYWPMPFKRHMRIVIMNESRDHRAGVYFHIDWLQLPSLPEDTLYFPRLV